MALETDTARAISGLVAAVGALRERAETAEQRVDRAEVLAAELRVLLERVRLEAQNATHRAEAAERMIDARRAENLLRRVLLSLFRRE